MRYNTGIRHTDSWDSCAPKRTLPRPLQHPQTAQSCGSYSFDARIKVLAEILFVSQYLSIDPKESLPRPL